MQIPSKSWQQAALVAAVLLFIFIGALLPVEIRRQVVGPFPRRMHADLIGHAAAFGTLAFLLASFGYLRPRHILLLALGLGVATEVAQFFVPGRTPLVSDVLVDILGAALGLVIARSWNQRRARNTRAGSASSNA